MLLLCSYALAKQRLALLDLGCQHRTECLYQHDDIARSPPSTTMPSPPTSGSVTPTNGGAGTTSPRSPLTPSPQRFSRNSRDAPVKVVKDPNPPQRVVRTSVVGLHPDFSGTGDVLIVCDEPDGKVGFRVSSRMLTMAR